MVKLIQSKLTLSAKQQVDLIDAAEQKVPQEVCGLLAGKAGTVFEIIKISNISKDTSTFRMAPEEQVAAFHNIEQDGFELVGIYHSHPFSPPLPSPTDIAECMYPDLPQVILGKLGSEWKLKAFIIQGDRFFPIRLEINPNQQPI